MIISLISDYQSKSNVEKFSCGNADLDDYLKKYAHQNHVNNISKTYLLIDDEHENSIVGYVTLCATSIRPDHLPKDYLKLPKYLVPAIKIARLAVDSRYQGQHFGKALLHYAFKKSITTSISVGVKLVVVDAKEESKSFYEKYGFISLPDFPLTYVIAIEKVINAVIK